MTAITDKTIDTINATRKLFIDLVDSLTLEQLNQIPAGFNNNIAWNFGHVVVTQQILCYKLANLPMKLDASYFAKYAKGTKPTATIDEAEIDYLKQQALLLIELLVQDVEKEIFTNYQPYTTSFEVTLSSIDDGTRYLAMHEGLHLGYAMALRRIVAPQ